jgi:hypothetical protein
LFLSLLMEPLSAILAHMQLLEDTDSLSITLLLLTASLLTVNALQILSIKISISLLTEVADTLHQMTTVLIYKEPLFQFLSYHHNQLVDALSIE